MGQKNGYFVLDYNDYSYLLGLKDKAQQDYDAMGAVVLTANMNVQVLMKDVLDKKKRAIARIDSSKEGRSFLKEQVNTSSEKELDTLLRRLKIGSMLYKRRKDVNTELINFQKQCFAVLSSPSEHTVSVVRFVRTRKDFYYGLSQHFTDEDDDDKFVILTLIEELDLLLKEIARSTN